MAAAAFMHSVRSGAIAADAPASLDGGHSFQPAGMVQQRLAQDDQAMSLVMPVRVETWAVLSGYLALFSLLFFGGPAVLVGVIAAWDPASKLQARVIFLAVGLVLGPLPIAACAALARRNLVRDPTQRGMGRVWFAFGVAGLLALACCAGMVGLVAR